MKLNGFLKKSVALMAVGALVVSGSNFNYTLFDMNNIAQVEAAGDSDIKSMLHPTVYSVLQILVNAKKDGKDFYKDVAGFTTDAEYNTKDITKLAVAAPYKTADITKDDLVVYDGKVNLRPYNLTASDLDGISSASWVTEISLPTGVKSIPAAAFRDMSSLKKVYMSSDVTTVESNAFQGCTSLAEVRIYNPSTGADDADNADDTLNLKYVKNIGNSSFQKAQKAKYIKFNPNVEKIDTNAFNTCTGLLEVTLPSVGKGSGLGTGVFNACSNLAKFTFADDITTIKTAFLSDCKPTGGMEIHFPTALTKIDVQAIQNTNVGKNNIASCTSLKTIEDYAFRDAEFKDSFDISGIKLNSIGKASFYQAFFKDTDFRLNDSIKTIGIGAFVACNLTSINIPDNVTDLQDGVFLFNYDLNEVICKSTSQLTRVGKYTFAMDGVLESTDFLVNAGKLETIDDYAFAFCNSFSDGSAYLTGLKEVKLPASVKKLGVGTFKDTCYLKDVDLSNTKITEIPSECFYIEETTAFPYFLNEIILLSGTSETEIKLVPTDGLKQMYALADPASALSGDLSAHLPSALAVVGDKGFSGRQHFKALWLGSKTKKEGVVDLSDTGSMGGELKKIGEEAFYLCGYYKEDTVEGKQVANVDGIKEMIMPDKVTEIGAKAFSMSYNLEKATISKNVKKIPAECFSNCAKTFKEMVTDEGGNPVLDGNNQPQYNDIPFGLRYVNLAELTSLEEIDDNAFMNDTYLNLDKTVSGADISEDSFNFPAKLSKINNNAFKGVAGTKRIKFNSGITSIGQYAFSGNSEVDMADFEDMDFSRAIKLETIGAGCFYCSYIKKADLTKTGIKTIDSTTFGNCPNLEDFAGPDTLEMIGDSAFMVSETFKTAEIKRVSFPVTTYLTETMFYGRYIKNTTLTITQGRYAKEAFKLPNGQNSVQSTVLDQKAFSNVKLNNNIEFRRVDKTTLEEYKVDQKEFDSASFFSAESQADGSIVLKGGDGSKGDTELNIVATYDFAQTTGGSKSANVKIPINIENVDITSVALDETVIQNAVFETDSKNEIVNNPKYVVHVSSAIKDYPDGQNIISLAANILPGTVTYKVDWAVKDSSVIAQAEAPVNTQATDAAGNADAKGFFNTKCSFKVLKEGKTDVTIGYYDNGKFQPVKTFTVMVQNPIQDLAYVVDSTGEQSYDVDILSGSKDKITTTPTYADPNSTFKDTVIFTTSDDSIVKVDNAGNVTAGNKEGVATVSMKAATGPILASIVYNVKTKNEDIRPTKLTITGDEFINVGATKTYTAKCSPVAASQKINWTISDPDGTYAKLKVNNGKAEVTAVSSGTVYLSASSDLNPGVAAQYAINIVQPATAIGFVKPNYLTSVDRIETVAIQNSSEATDGIIRLPAESQESITYKSSNSSVLLVSADGQTFADTCSTSGYLYFKGVGKGTANILASTESGCSSMTAVEVVGSPIASLRFAEEGKKIPVGGTAQLVVVKDPVDSDEAITFESSDPTTVAVDQFGNITALKKGVASITVKSTIEAFGIKAVAINVEVIDDVTPGKDIDLDGTVYTFNQDGTVTYKATTAGITDFIVPESVTVNGEAYKVSAIAPGAFRGNKTMTSVSMPESIKVIGAGAFENCAKLATVTVGAGVTTIEANAFAGCKKLTTLTIGDNVTTIGNNAFKNCKALTTVTIPKKVKSIGANAFAGCKKLKTVIFKTTKLTKVGKKAFKTIKKGATFKCPKKKLSKYKKLIKKSGAPKKAKYKKG